MSLFLSFIVVCDKHVGLAAAASLDCAEHDGRVLDRAVNELWQAVAFCKNLDAHCHAGKFCFVKVTKKKIISYLRVVKYFVSMNEKDVYILAIESSCDDTSAAVMRGNVVLSNVTAGQAVHEQYGGVVPELASRAHELNIVPVVDAALKRAGVAKEQLSAIAFTRGPGLMGSLLVGVSFAKGLAASLGIPMVEVNHLQGHIMAHFIEEEGVEHKVPEFPFLCLMVSGGNSQIVKVNSYKDMEIVGQTIDDAAGEAMDKCAKVMGLGYPGGPIIDRLARQGNPKAYAFSKPHIPGFDYSFSGLKTSFLYTLRKLVAEDENYVETHKEDLAASFEATVVAILMDKLYKASKSLGIKRIALSGGVSANTALRQAYHDYAKRYGWEIFIPKFGFTTDNAAMIGIVGYYKYLDNDFCAMDQPAFTRTTL